MLRLDHLLSSVHLVHKIQKMNRYRHLSPFTRTSVWSGLSNRLFLINRLLNVVRFLI